MERVKLTFVCLFVCLFGDLQGRSRTSASFAAKRSANRRTWSRTCASTPVTSPSLAASAKRPSSVRWICAGTATRSIRPWLICPCPCPWPPTATSNRNRPFPVPKQPADLRLHRYRFNQSSRLMPSIRGSTSALWIRPSDRLDLDDGFVRFHSDWPIFSCLGRTNRVSFLSSLVALTLFLYSNNNSSNNNNNNNNVIIVTIIPLYLSILILYIYNK